MAEYIDKAELMENYPEFDGYTFADVTTIEIVHCKDCKYCKIEDWDKNNFRVCTRDRYIRSGSWFCAGGVRKE